MCILINVGIYIPIAMEMVLRTDRACAQARMLTRPIGVPATISIVVIFGMVGCH